MKISIKTMVASITSFLKLVHDDNLPGATKHRIKRMWKVLKPEYEQYEETRMGLCHQYGVLNEKTNQYEFPDGRKAFDAEMQALLAVEVEVPGEPLKDADLVRKLGASDPLNADDLLNLEWLIPDEIMDSDILEESKS